MQRILSFVENNLLVLAVAAAALGLLVPSIGIVLESGIGPLLGKRPAKSPSELQH